MLNYLKIIGTIVLIVGGLIGIWQWAKPSHKLEAYVVSTKAPLSQEILDSLKEMGEFSIEKIRQRYKEVPEIAKVPEGVLRQALPVFSKVVKDRVEFIVRDELGLRQKEYLTAITIHNAGDQTLTGVELKHRFPVKESAQIEREDGKLEAQKYVGKLVIGTLPPLSSVTVYIHSLFPGGFSEGYVLTHDKGVGEIFYSRPVPTIITKTGGIWFSYYWTTVVLAICLLAILLFFSIRWFVRHRRLKPQ